MLATTPQTLTLASGRVVRYHPLPGLAVADYVEEHAHLLETSGAFDSLKYSAAEMRFGEGKLDLAGLAAIGSALAVALTKSVQGAKQLRTLILDHVQRFKLHGQTDAGAWVELTAENIDAHLDFTDMVQVVTALAGGVLRPLWNLLRSPDEVKRSESPKPSPSASPAN